MKKFAPLFFVLILVAISLACSSPFSAQATSTPMPTYTALPTYTPFPTNTPVPTPTKVVLLGIDSFAPINGLSLKFFSGTITTSAATVGDKTLTPNAGFAVVVLKGYYKGDLLKVFSEDLQSEDGLYIDDGTGAKKPWVQVNFSDSEITLGFFVKEGASQYILKNTVGKPWEIDLGHFLSQ